MEKIISLEIYDKLDEANKISAMYPDKAYEMSKEAYNLSIKSNLKTEEGFALIGMALACRAKTEINNMLDCSLKALEIFEEVDNIFGQVKSINLIGIAYFYNSMYDDALKHLLQINERFSNLIDYLLLSSVLNNIGEVYRETFMYDKALEYYHKALNICVDKNFKLNTATILGNIGEIYFVENKYNDSLEYFEKSYEILINENDMVHLGEVENKLGKVYYIVGNHEKAEEYFFCALTRLENINNKFYAIDVLINIAKLKYARNSKESINYFERAMIYAESVSAKKKLCEVYKLISEYYENTEDYRTALEYYKNFNRVNEEINASNLGNKLEILKIELGHFSKNDKFDNIKRRLEIEIFNQKHELDKIKKSNEILEKKAYEDELTVIPNRRFINKYLNKVWENPRFNNEIIALFMIDIDNFKKYNDYWGHSIGDECLKKVATCINNINIMRSDVFGRYGGEEFVYIAKELNYVQALELGDLIRNEVEKLNIDYLSNNMKKTITISVGGTIGKISEYKSMANMLQIADEQLYKAKDMGRNTVVIKNKQYFKN